MTNKLKTSRPSKTAFLLAVFFLLSQTAITADAEHLGSGPNSRPGISPSDVQLSNSNALPVDSNTEFFNGSALSMIETKVEVLSLTEKAFVQDLSQKLPVEMPEVQGHEEQLKPIGIVEKTIESLQRKMDESKSGNMLTKPYAFLSGLKQEAKASAGKKMKSFNRESTDAQETESEAAAEVLPLIPAGRVMLDMKLEVTPELVKAAEDLNFSAEHPWLGWLAMKGIPEAIKATVAKAETQRQVMLEMAKEAEKNGQKIVFIANKKVLSFYFNAPLFIEGDYQLLILDDSTDLTPQISLE